MRLVSFWRGGPADLQRKLHAAYVTKERNAQVTHRLNMTATARQEDLKAQRELEEAAKQAEKEEQEQERRKWEEARKYQADIEEQLEDQERRKEEAYQEVGGLNTIQLYVERKG